jgi:hypothetical protein
MQQSAGRARGLGETTQTIGEEIGGPFAAAPWYLSTEAKTVDLYSSLGYKSSQYENSENWKKTSTVAPAFAAAAPSNEVNATDESAEYRPDLTPNVRDHQRPDKRKMSVSDEAFDERPKVSLLK